MNVRNIIALLGLMIIFIGSTGIPVFEHQCSESGVTYGFFTKVDHRCHTKVRKESCGMTEEMSCCDESATIPEDLPVLEEECCSTTVNIVKVKSEFTVHSADGDFESNPELIQFNRYTARDDAHRVSQDNKGPPLKPFKSSRRRAILQTYLI